MYLQELVHNINIYDCSKDSVNTELPQNKEQLQPSTDGGSITQL